MKAEIIPLLIVDDVPANVEYLEDTLGFGLDHTVDDEELAVMKYRGATVMIQNRKACAAGRGISTKEHIPADGIALLIRVDDIEQAYTEAQKNKARVTGYLQDIANTSGPSIRRFNVALPEGHIITLFSYIRNQPEIA
jgi:predicted enzyme related to lactoylglutathione lyase